MAQNIAKFFKNYRFMNNLTQADLAKKLEVKQPYLARIESGSLKFPVMACKGLYNLCSKDEKKILLNCVNEDIKSLLNE